MPKPVLVIGNKNYSSWSLRPWLLLKHLGVDFDEVRIPLYVEGAKERILEYSPGGKVPVYIDGGVTIWESLAIMEYLADSHPSVWPPGLAGEYMEAVLSDPHMQDWLRAGEEETEVLEFCEV